MLVFSILVLAYFYPDLLKLDKGRGGHLLIKP